MQKSKQKLDANSDEEQEEYLITEENKLTTNSGMFRFLFHQDIHCTCTHGYSCAYKLAWFSEGSRSSVWKPGYIQAGVIHYNTVVYYSKSRTLLFVEPRLRQRHQLSGLLKFDSGSAAVFAVTDINLKWSKAS